MKIGPVPSLWFEDKCEEAVNYYVSIFPNSSIESLEKYPDENLNEHFKGMTGKIITADFTLMGVKFRALDGGKGTDAEGNEFKLNEAVSFTIHCEDQEEIDFYWEKLSHYKENEICGWCKDKYGVSWQIIPDNMSELISDDNALKEMFKMKKIIISDLEKARNSEN